MYKKLISSVFLAASLVFLASCEKQEEKKDMKKDKNNMSYQRDSRKGTYNRGRNNNMPKKNGENGNMPKATMPNGKCPEDKPCSEPRKTCPSGCKKKCCANKANENVITEKDSAVLKERQEIISLQDLTNKDLPFEDLKAAIEKDSLEIEE